MRNRLRRAARLTTAALAGGVLAAAAGCGGSAGSGTSTASASPAKTLTSAPASAGQVAQASVCPAYGAAAVAGSTVYEPCEQGGMAAISTAGNKIHVLWRGPSDPRRGPGQWGSGAVCGTHSVGHKNRRAAGY